MRLTVRLLALVTLLLSLIYALGVYRLLGPVATHDLDNKYFTAFLAALRLATIVVALVTAAQQGRGVWVALWSVMLVLDVFGPYIAGILIALDAARLGDLAAAAGRPYGIGVFGWYLLLIRIVAPVLLGTSALAYSFSASVPNHPHVPTPPTLTMPSPATDEP